MLPQVGQGALAVECRAGDERGRRPAGRHRGPGRDRAAVDAERAFLAELGGGCDLPVGAYARLDGDGALIVEGLLASLDGRIVVRDRLSGGRDQPAELGRRLAERLLSEGGGAALMDGLVPGDTAPVPAAGQPGP